MVRRTRAKQYAPINLLHRAIICKLGETIQWSYMYIYNKVSSFSSSVTNGWLCSDTLIMCGSTDREILLITWLFIWNLIGSLFALILHSTGPENYFTLLSYLIWIVQEISLHGKYIICQIIMFNHIQQK